MRLASISFVPDTSVLSAGKGVAGGSTPQHSDPKDRAAKIYQVYIYMVNAVVINSSWSRWVIGGLLIAKV